MLPADLRAYFTSVNGTAAGRFGMEDDDLRLLALSISANLRRGAGLPRDVPQLPPQAASVFAIPIIDLGLRVRDSAVCRSSCPDAGGCLVRPTVS